MKTISRMAHPQSGPQPRPQRRDRLVRERVHDPYRAREKPTEPTYCPACSVAWHKGRWQWSEEPPQGARAVLCPACRRVRDAAPAGLLTIEGWFVPEHKDEIVGLVRRCEEDERSTHPLNRIMSVREEGNTLEVSTTDIHLPRRIGEALAKAYDGRLSFRTSPEEYFLRVDWRRDV